MPLVSVIIPCYNAARFLAQAIESVLAQTHQPAELLLIDDGSTDETPEIAAAYGEKLRYCRQENRGAAAARNLGIGLARGEFVAFLDADDIWFPGKLELQINLFRQDPSLGMVYTDCYSIDEAGRQTGFYLKRKLFRGKDLVENIFIKDFIPNSTILVRAGCLDQVGPLDESIDLCEDEDLKIRLADAFPIGHVPIPLAGWRQHAGNKSLLVTKLKETFAHDTAILIGKFPRLERQKRLRAAILHENCGLLFLRERQARPARRDFLKAIRLNPRRPRTWAFFLLSLPGSGTVNALIRLKKQLEMRWARGEGATGGSEGKAEK